MQTEAKGESEMLTVETEKGARLQEAVTLHHEPGKIALRDQRGSCVAVLYGEGEKRDEWGERIALRWNAHDGLLAALERINEFACYASEENTGARADMLLQIGQTARAAINKALGKE